MLETSKFTTFDRHGVKWNYTYFPGDAFNAPIEEYEPADFDGVLITRIGDTAWRIDKAPCYRVRGGSDVIKMRSSTVYGENPPLDKVAGFVTSELSKTRYSEFFDRVA